MTNHDRYCSSPQMGEGDENNNKKKKRHYQTFCTQTRRLLSVLSGYFSCLSLKCVPFPQRMLPVRRTGVRHKGRTPLLCSSESRSSSQSLVKSLRRAWQKQRVWFAYRNMSQCSKRAQGGKTRRDLWLHPTVTYTCTMLEEKVHADPLTISPMIISASWESFVVFGNRSSDTGDASFRVWLSVNRDELVFADDRQTM